MNGVSAHDPDGKITTSIPAGMLGDAEFGGHGGEYRHWLSRNWGDPAATTPAFALWIGLNPSTARHDVNDPTITREINFTKRLSKVDAYYKANVMDYRSTKPEGLLLPDINPRSEKNIETIRDLASRATLIILACGVPHMRFWPYVNETIKVLQNDGHELWCLGKTLQGWPKHPLYLQGETQLQSFRP